MIDFKNKGGTLRKTTNGAVPVSPTQTGIVIKQVLYNKKIIYSGNPDAFLPVGRTIRSDSDITLYEVFLDDNDLKIGFTDVDKYNLMAQYSGGGRFYSRARKFEQFVHIDIDYIRDIIGKRINPGFVAKYERVKTDDMVRDALLELGLVFEAPEDVVNGEVVSIPEGENLVSLLEKLCETVVRTLPTHSFIDRDVKEIVEEHSKLEPNQLLLAFMYKAPRYWKDFLLLNIESNLPQIKNIVLPSKMLTTHSGLISKLKGYVGYTYIDTTPDGKLSYSKIVELYNDAKQRGDTVVWAVSGFDGKSEKRKEVLELIQNIPDSEKLFDIDEVDWAAWKSLRDMIESCLNGNGGNPVVMLKTGSGYDDVLSGIKLGKLKENIQGYSVRYFESITTQQDLEKAKFIDLDPSVNHVLAKGEVFIEIDDNSCAFVNENFDSDTITGYSKAYEDGDKAWFTSLLEMFFKPELSLGVSNRFYLPNILNKCIDDLIIKHEAYFKDKDTSVYTDRTIIGVQINTQAPSGKSFTKFVNTLSTVTTWPIFDASETKRRNIENDVQKWIEKNQQSIINAGGFVIANPNWAMANRSFSQGLIDITLELKDKTDGQAEMRPLTDTSKYFNNGLTLDGKQKIIGPSVHLPLSKETNTISQSYENFLSEPGHSTDDKRRKALTPVLNHWRFIKDNQFIMEERDHDPYIDLSKTLRSQTMAEVDFDWIDSNADKIEGIRKVKKQKTKKLKTGRSGSYIDPKNSNGNISTNELEEYFRQVEQVINSTTWLIEYAKYLKITDLDFEDMIQEVKKNKKLNDDFFGLTNITIDTWEEIYYNAITVKGKNRLHHLYNMDR